MTTDMQQKLNNAIKMIELAKKSLSSAKKRKKHKRNPCNGCATANPRTHFPKTKRGRPQVKRSWTITQKGKPPLRFKATKNEAFARAKKIAGGNRAKRLVLDGPK